MKNHLESNGSLGWLAMALVTGIALGAAPVAWADPEGRYQRHDLVSDQAGVADHQDPHLVNAWGIAFNPFGFVWVSDAETGVSTLYDGAGNPQQLVVTIPPAAGADSGNPTGIVFNASSGFVVNHPPPCTPSATVTCSGAAAFMFATEDGVIAGWNPKVDGTHAILIKDNSSSGASYKGLALSAGGTGSLLYATDFHNGKIDVWDSNLTR